MIRIKHLRKVYGESIFLSICPCKKEGNITILPTYTALLEINKMKQFRTEKTL